jgi:hypothetical protein
MLRSNIVPKIEAANQKDDTYTDLKQEFTELFYEANMDALTNRIIFN